MSKPNRAPETEMKLLRMQETYILWTSNGNKTATTRTKNKGTGRFELVWGSRFKPIKSGVCIEIYQIVDWTRATISERLKERILKAENFTDWNTLIGILEKLNKRKIGVDDVLYTHFYRVIKPKEGKK